MGVGVEDSVTVKRIVKDYIKEKNYDKTETRTFTATSIVARTKPRWDFRRVALDFCVSFLFVCFFVLSVCVSFFLFLFFLSCVVREHDQWGVTARWFPDEDLANDRLRYGVLGDVYSRGGSVDFLNAHVVQFLEGSQSVVGHFQWWERCHCKER